MGERTTPHTPDRSFTRRKRHELAETNIGRIGSTTDRGYGYAYELLQGVADPRNSRQPGRSIRFPSPGRQEFGSLDVHCLAVPRGSSGQLAAVELRVLPVRRYDGLVVRSLHPLAQRGRSLCSRSFTEKRRYGEPARVCRSIRQGRVCRGLWSRKKRGNLLPESGSLHPLRASRRDRSPERTERHHPPVHRKNPGYGQQFPPSSGRV